MIVEVCSLLTGKVQPLVELLRLLLSCIELCLCSLLALSLLPDDGILLRWLHGRHWSAELGWTDQFHDNNNTGVWNEWLLGSGAYGKLRYRF